VLSFASDFALARVLAAKCPRRTIRYGRFNFSEESKEMLEELKEKVNAIEEKILQIRGYL